MEHCCADVPPLLPGDRHFSSCPHGIRATTTCHDPVVAALAVFAAGAMGAHRVIAEHGLGAGGVQALNQWMVRFASLRHRPDLVLTDLDGPGTFTLVDVKTLDAAGATHIAAEHTDRDRLAAHRASVETWTRSYGALPQGCRLVVFVVSAGGSIGSAAQALLARLGERTAGLPPFLLLDQSSWATPRFAPMARMAITFAARSGLAAAVRSSWRRVPRGRPRYGPPSDGDDDDDGPPCAVLDIGSQSSSSAGSSPHDDADSSQGHSLG